MGRRKKEVPRTFSKALKLDDRTRSPHQWPLRKRVGEVERGEQHLKAKTQNLCWPECPPDQLSRLQVSFWCSSTTVVGKSYDYDNLGSFSDSQSPSFLLFLSCCPPFLFIWSWFTLISFFVNGHDQLTPAGPVSIHKSKRHFGSVNQNEKRKKKEKVVRRVEVKRKFQLQMTWPFWRAFWVSFICSLPLASVVPPPFFLLPAVVVVYM